MKATLMGETRTWHWIRRDRIMGKGKKPTADVHTLTVFWSIPRLGSKQKGCAGMIDFCMN